MIFSSLGPSLRRVVLMAGAVALAGTMSLGLAGEPAQGALLVSSAESSEPVYPSASPSSESEDQDSILIPSVTSQEGKFYLAVSDAAIDDIDSQKIMDAVREAVDGQNAKILLGVDKKPNNLKGASQLVRGMLLFGDSDAMSDDWLENGKTKGYVGEGWIAIGVMLPETVGGETEVYVDPGRNVKETETGSKDRILEAGATDFAAGNYTSGISAVAVSATENLRTPMDKKIVISIVVGVLALIVAVIVFFALRQKRRLALKIAAQKRTNQAEGWESTIRQDLNALRRIPTNRFGVAEKYRSSRALQAIQLEKERVLAEQDGAENTLILSGDEPHISQAQAQRLEQEAEHLALLRRAVELSRALSGTQNNSVKSWNQIIEQHRGGLELLVQFLDLDGASQLEVSRGIRTALVTHTDALDQLRQRTKSSSDSVQAGELLEELWVLREELDSLIDSALTQSGKARVKLDAKLQAQLAAFLPAAGAKPNDPLSVLRAFAPESGKN